MGAGTPAEEMMNMSRTRAIYIYVIRAKQFLYKRGIFFFLTELLDAVAAHAVYLIPGTVEPPLMDLPTENYGTSFGRSISSCLPRPTDRAVYSAY